MKRVSVVIPTYNRASQVPVAVRSVLEQKDVICEVIVIDDGSTDDTESALAPFAGLIRYIKTANGGVSAARTAAFWRRRRTGLHFLTPMTPGTLTNSANNLN